MALHPMRGAATRWRRLRTDAPVLSLPVAETLVLAGIRLWAAAVRDPAATPAGAWRRTLHAAAIGAPAIAGFDAFMALIAAGATRSLDVRCPSCRQLGADEALLIHVVGALQDGQRRVGAILLGEVLAPAALVPALAALAPLAEAMDATDLRVGAGPTEVANDDEPAPHGDVHLGPDATVIH